MSALTVTTPSKTVYSNDSNVLFHSHQRRSTLSAILTMRLLKISNLGGNKIRRGISRGSVEVSSRVPKVKILVGSSGFSRRRCYVRRESVHLADRTRRMRVHTRVRIYVHGVQPLYKLCITYVTAVLKP